MAWIAVIAVIASLLAGGGMAYAADGAAPGDALYSLDRAIEQVRLDLTSNPQAALELQLALATERLEEAKVLLSRAAQDRFSKALGNYDATVALVAETVQSSAAADQVVLGGLLDAAIASHDALLADMIYGDQVRAGDRVQIRDQDRLCWCSDLISGTLEITPTIPITMTQHPVALALAETWGVTYEEIIGYFCQSYGFGEINIAFRISEATGIPVVDLLAEHSDSDMGWGLLLREYDLIGPVKAQGPDGAPHGPVELGGQGAGPKSQGPVRAGEGDGPQGPQEPQGVQEPQGPQGPQGLQEPQGPQGPQGVQGPPEDVPQGPQAQEGRPEDAGAPAGVPQGAPAGQVAPGQGQGKP
jgi:hypothetical protein